VLVGHKNVLPGNPAIPKVLCELFTKFSEVALHLDSMYVA